MSGMTTANTSASVIAGREFNTVNSSGGTLGSSIAGANIALMHVWTQYGPGITGDFIIRFASEIAAHAVTIKAGSFLRYRKTL